MNNFQRQSISSKCLEGNYETFKKMRNYAFYNVSMSPRYMALFSKRCISETAALICMCDTPSESVLNGLIGGIQSPYGSRALEATILRISTRRARPTAIVVPLVSYHTSSMTTFDNGDSVNTFTRIAEIGNHWDSVSSLLKANCLIVCVNKWSLICSTFLGTINLLHFTPLFVFTSCRYHIIF